MIAVRPTGGEWKIMTRSAVGNGVPNFLNITVTAGAANSGGYGLAIMSITPDKTTVTQNERFNVTSRTRNVSQDTFPNGQMGAALVDNNGNIVSVIGSVSFNALNSGNTWTRTISNCAVPNTVRPGQYRLMIVVRPGNNNDNNQWRLATLSYQGAETSINFTVR